MKFILVLVFSISVVVNGYSYSVLTHEAIIDVAWETSIVPLLKSKFPKADSIQLKDARAYAYGGSLVADMGYYPFGSRLFTDLLHYVRTGDFVQNMLDDAKDIKEYSFALGTLAHYYADNYGHPIGINPGLPLIFEKAKTCFGDTVTYAQAPVSHIRTEFSFDVIQAARGNYAPLAFHEFIGFKIADSLLRRVFKATYGLSVDDLFKNYKRAVNTFRWSIKNVLPELTRSAWKAKRSEITKARPGISGRNYIFRMRNKQYYKEFGNEIDKPGFFSRVVTGLVRILPKIGPLKKLKVVIPGPEAEKLFLKSFDTVSKRYIVALSNLKKKGNLLENKDFDTGRPAVFGEYTLADDVFVRWVNKLKEQNNRSVDAGIRKSIEVFYKKQ
jgi:hypothetical protein